MIIMKVIGVCYNRRKTLEGFNNCKLHTGLYTFAIFYKVPVNTFPYSIKIPCLTEFLISMTSINIFSEIKRQKNFK